MLADVEPSIRSQARGDEDMMQDLRLHALLAWRRYPALPYAQRTVIIRARNARRHRAFLERTYPDTGGEADLRGANTEDTLLALLDGGPGDIVVQTRTAGAAGQREAQSLTARGWSAKRIAEKLGVAERTVVRWRRQGARL